MKKLKITLLKKHNAIIRIILSVLGFGTACSIGSCEYGSPAMEYGTPSATFIVKGKVSSEETSSAISNIKVVMGYDSAYTDTEGNYKVENTEFPQDQSFSIEFEDIDGPNNGKFQPLDTVVVFKNPVFTGGSGSWDEGNTEKEFNVNLKPQK